MAGFIIGKVFVIDGVAVVAGTTVAIVVVAGVEETVDDEIFFEELQAAIITAVMADKIILVAFIFYKLGWKIPIQKYYDKILLAVAASYPVSLQVFYHFFFGLNIHIIIVKPKINYFSSLKF